MQDSNNKKRIHSILLFLFVGAAITFPLGLFMLTKGPTRYLASIAKNNAWSASAENSLQKILIVVFLIFCSVLAYICTQRLQQMANLKSKNLWILFLSFCLGYSCYVFAFQPELLISKETENDNVRTATTTFYFGSYPDEEKLEQLHKEHYTAVVSLLHEMVVPAEPILQQKEATLAKKIGIKVISIPMLPWIVDNDSAIVKIKQLAKNGKGKYYVHCYLGRDRASLFKNILQTENKKAIIAGKLDCKSIHAIHSFERGKIDKIKPDVFLTPYPTNEEFFSYIFNGQIKTIVNLLPLQNIEEKELLAKEEKWCMQYNTGFIHIPNAISERKMRLLIPKIEQLPKPLVIHSFHSDAPEMKLIKKLLLEKNNPKK